MPDAILQKRAVASYSPAAHSPPESSDDDALAAARGIVHGLAASAVLWAVILACLFLAGCGGSSGPQSSAASVSDGPPPSSPAPGSSSNAPLPVCSVGTTPVYAGACQCPQADVQGPSCIVPQAVLILPVCPVGSTELYVSTCQCPNGDANGSTCVVPAPQPPPPPPPPAPPTMSLTDCAAAPPAACVAPPDPLPPGTSVVLEWTSTGATACYGAAGWPTSDALTPAGFVSTPALTAVTSYTLTCDGSGGNASASLTVTVGSGGGSGGPPPPPTCTPPDVLINNVCEPPPTLTVSLSLNPTTVVDDSKGCPDPAGDTCTAVLTITDGSSLQGDALNCYVNGSTDAVNTALGWSSSPYPAAQDGPQVITVVCRDVYNQSATAAITLTVAPPSGPPLPDTLTATANGDGSYTFTWWTDSAAGQGGCFVELGSSSGLGPYGSETALQPGGTASGSASSAYLSPAYGSVTATLYCSGAPDPGVPSVTVNP